MRVRCLGCLRNNSRLAGAGLNVIFLTMSALLKPDHRHTWEEYEAILDSSPVKLEFQNGVIVPWNCNSGDVENMAGGTDTHSVVKANVVRHLGNALSKRPCRIHDSDMKVKVEATNWGAFPDASIVCGTPKFQDLRRLSLLNPCAIVEVISESTAAYDKGKKFWNYRHLDSLHTYMLVATDEPMVEVFERMDGGDWRLRTFEDLNGLIRLERLDLELPLSALFEKTHLHPDGAMDGIAEA